MKSKIVLLFSAVFFCFAMESKSQATSKELDAKNIIQNCIQKIGGIDYLKSIQTLRTELTTKMGDADVLWITKEKLPNKGSFLIIYKGNVVFQSWFNGIKGFETNKGSIIESSSNEIVDKYTRKNIFNELDYLDSSIYTISRLDDKKIANIDCFTIQAKFIAGTIRTLYIDKSTFNTIRQDQTKPNSSAVSVSYYSDFKKFGKLYYYGKLTLEGGANTQTLTITKIDVNQGISDEDFEISKK